MSVTIIIPNYNGQKFLKECLDSLKSQTYKDFDVILVDNASIDNSITLAKSLLSQIKIIKLEENKGFSKAVNEGIKNSKTKYVVLLNNDTVATPSWLESLVYKIKEDSQIFSCSSKMIQYNNRERIDDAGDAYTFFGWAYQKGHGDSVHSNSFDKNIFSSCAGAAIYRTEIFREIGYFDENFFAYLEDVDIGYRAKIRGYKNVYCSNAEIYHIGSATSGHGLSSLKVKLTARNGLYLFYKNQPLLQLLINLPFVIFGNLYRYLYFRKLGYGQDFKNGIKTGIFQIKYIKKTKFKFKFLLNYFQIQYEILKAGFSFAYNKLLKNICKKNN